MRCPMSQMERVYKHLLARGSITNSEAHNVYGIRHLPSVIRDIKKHYGVNIVDTWVKGINRFKEKCHWKAYSLEKTDDPKTA